MIKISRTKYFKICIALSLFVMMGCAGKYSTISKVHPGPELHFNEISILHMPEQYKTGGSIIIVSLDGQRNHVDFDYDELISLLPGSHTITVYYYHHSPGYSENTMTSSVNNKTLKFSSQAEHIYTLKYEVNKATMKWAVWIEDITNSQLSNEIILPTMKKICPSMFIN